MGISSIVVDDIKYFFIHHLVDYVIDRITCDHSKYQKNDFVVNIVPAESNGRPHTLMVKNGSMYKHNQLLRG